MTKIVFVVLAKLVFQFLLGDSCKNSFFNIFFVIYNFTNFLSQLKII